MAVTKSDYQERVELIEQIGRLAPIAGPKIEQLLKDMNLCLHTWDAFKLQSMLGCLQLIQTMKSADIVSDDESKFEQRNINSILGMMLRNVDVMLLLRQEGQKRSFGSEMSQEEKAESLELLRTAANLGSSLLNVFAMLKKTNELE